MLAPKARVATNNTIKIKKRILAIEAAPAAMPPNPKTAAIIAIIKNVTAQRNIVVEFKLNLKFNGRVIMQHLPVLLVEVREVMDTEIL